MGVSVSGPWGFLLIAIGSRILGSMLDKNIIRLDLTLDHLKEAAKDPMWREQVGKIYSKAIERVYTDAEKEVIRRQYMDTLKQYATFVDSMSDNQNP